MSRLDRVVDVLSMFDVLLQPKTGPRVINTPKPVPVHPFGPGYSLHPELSRSAIWYFIGESAFVSAPMAVGLWAGSLFVLTASEHQVKGITGEAQFGLPVTKDNPFFRR